MLACNSGNLTSSAVIFTTDLVIFLISFSAVSTPAPPFPITTPGFDTLIVKFRIFPDLSIRTSLSPAKSNWR